MSDTASRGPGRPRNFDEAEALDQLVFLFWEKGYQGCKQADMAAATGLATSSIFNAFGDKPSIFRRVLRRYFDMGSQPLAPLADAGSLPELIDLLDFIATFIASPQGSNGCLMATSSAELTDADPDVTDLITEFRSRLRDLAHAAFDHAVTEGELEPGDNSARAGLIVGTWFGAFTTARAGGIDDAIATVEGAKAAINAWKPRS